MRLISTEVLQTGMVIGRTIWNEIGRPLLQKGVKVSDLIIKRLQELNIQYVYIDDSISKDIEVKEAIPRTVRQHAVQQITSSFNQLKMLKGKDVTYCLDRQSKQFTLIIDDLLNNIMNNKEILTILSDAFLYDNYIYQHSLQVAVYSIAIAKEMKYNAVEIRQIGIGAILHDIGKMMIPQEILKKPGRLTNEEYEIMKQHTKYGFDILRNLHTISLLSAHCAFQHHERLDGSGYPRGLLDFEIHPYAKIIAVADVFDAVTSNRVYRNKMLPSLGMDIIKEGSGTLYDEKVVNALRRCVAYYPNGTVLLLSDGRRGIVCKQNKENTERPWVRIFEENNEILKATYEILLADEVDLSVKKVEVEYLSQVE
ncbi:HD-GYP domain-containing protein [Rummeliibacillus sp. POC4]|uniref:HD-GYP domain-containing protein n=1 Tax=Rummeliibacillus sp. POC4 TaxID=2305899 RepID=UPI000E66A6FF|nr:HD domain-containing phosphohydrolase [Rummeliibacillus sp. POC4]RIJ63953.1 HD-GYP domain-containing protein [Rummeliibacillus sp. POC4]